MKKKSDQLDNIVRNKLNQLHVEYDPASWEKLEQKLATEEASVLLPAEHLLDELVSEKMHQIKVGNQANQHWKILAARLQEEGQVRRRLVLYKFMEASLVLLLLLVAAPYLYHPATFDANKNKGVNKTNFNPKGTPVVMVEDEGCEVRNNNDIVNRTIDNSKKPTSNSNSIANKKIISGQSTSFTNNDAANTITIQEQTIAASITSPPQHYLESPALNNKPLQKQYPYYTTSELQLNQIELNLLDALDGIRISELQYKAAKDYTMLIQPVKKRPRFIIGMFGSADYNRIITPHSSQGDQALEKLARYALGYGGGITAGLDLGRWEINTGAIYTSKQYEPRPVLYVSGNLREGYLLEGIKHIQLDVINIPFHLRYNFIYRDKWRAYATAGVSLQVAFQNNYFITDQTAFKEELHSIGVSSDPQNQVIAHNKSRLDSDALPKGFLEGGSLWQNGYLTGNFGVGLERYITGRWSLFAQPTYHHSLQYFTHGLGPDKDRIHTMSFFTGVRVRLSD